MYLGDRQLEMFSGYYTDMDVDVALCRHGETDIDSADWQEGPRVPSSAEKFSQMLDENAFFWVLPQGAEQMHFYDTPQVFF